MLGAEVLSLRSERTWFAETLGGLRLQWMDFEKDVESQVCQLLPVTSELKKLVSVKARRAKMFSSTP